MNLIAILGTVRASSMLVISCERKAITTCFAGGEPLKMNADLEKKKAMLQARNAQLVYYRSLRESGLNDPDSLFQFVDPAQVDNLMEAIILHRSMRPEEDMPSRDAALNLVIEWLAKRTGTVLLLVPNVGILQGWAADFLRFFDYFSPLLAVNLLFASDGTDEFVECSKFEGSYVCRTSSP
jgi:hypothetical protein